MEKYVRQCCKCGKDIIVKNKYYFNASLKKNYPCASCSAKIRTNGINNPRFKNIAGLKFNYLTAVEPVQTKLSESKNSSGFYWKFKCVCGKIVEKHAGSVKSGLLKSCGCKAFEDFLGKDSPIWEGYGEIPKTYFTQLKNGSKIRNGKLVNIVFKLDIVYLWDLFLKQDRKCALSGIELCFGTSAQVKNAESRKQTASLDRIDSSKGYTEGNVQWIHKDINKMKQNFNEDYFLNFCKKITEYQNLKK